MADTTAEAGAARAVAAQDHWIDAGGVRLFARAWTPAATAGAPVVLQHDSLGSVELWRSFPERLAAVTGRRVIAYDRHGFGRSDARTDQVARDFVAAEARDMLPAVLEQLGVEAFVACGHSIGGGMSVETAAQMPGRCVALVTIAAQALAEQHTLDGIAVARAEFQDPANLGRLARYHGEKARWVVDAWTETWLSAPFADWTLDATIAQVRCPILAIHGERDEYGTLEHPRRIVAGGGRMHVLPQTGHVPHRECEEVLVDLIAGFLAEVAPA